MPKTEATCPLTGKDVLDRYFLENRARLIEIAAFLDRVDRTRDREAAKTDFRYQEFLQALRISLESDGDRAAAVLQYLSDATEQPVAAAGGKGAVGAWAGRSEP